MTVDEAKKLRKEFEENVRTLIMDFESRTGTVITVIDVSWEHDEHEVYVSCIAELR